MPIDQAWGKDDKKKSPWDSMKKNPWVEPDSKGNLILIWVTPESEIINK